ncbi:MAG: phytase [Planctomycetota bacterium]
MAEVESRNRSLRGHLGAAGAVMVLGCGTAAGRTPQVQATIETEPVPSIGDAADDAAIWIHPAHPDLSRVIGTDKCAGVAAYDLAGLQRQFLPDGELNNVDLRYDFPLGGVPVDIVAAGNRTNDTIAVYGVDPVTGVLRDVAAGALPVGVGEAYGFCLYHSPVSGAYYAFVNDKDGMVEQWRLQDNGHGRVEHELVRSFSVGSQTEGMVADDELGRLYVSEEDVGIWCYGAEPDSGTQRTLVDSTGDQGHLTADVEGLTIYYAGDGTGYLIASSQGSGQFAVYRRRGHNDYIMTFEVVGGAGIDDVSGTDGIDVCNLGLGSAFPLGVFVAQDGQNPGGNQNYKLVPWEAIAAAADPPLSVDTTWDPRGLRGDIDGDGTVGIVDFLTLIAAWGPCPVPPGPCPADVDRDGAVGVTDLLILLSHWQ